MANDKSVQSFNVPKVRQTTASLNMKNLSQKQVKVRKDVKRQKKAVNSEEESMQGCVEENATVPAILTHLLKKPEEREEDFLKSDIYSSPMFRLDTSKFK